MTLFPDEDNKKDACKNYTRPMVCRSAESIPQVWSRIKRGLVRTLHQQL